MSEWIKVEDRLPDDVGPYQAVSSFGYAFVFWLGEELRFRDMQSGCLSGEYNEEFGTVFKVTHWMPIPPLPQK